MDLDEQYGNPTGSSVQREIGPFLARVTAPAPAAATDDLFVVILSYDGGRHRHGPCVWQPVDTLPAEGQACVVMRALEEDGEGEQIAVLTFDRLVAP